jgi:hypothetical protein
MAYQSMSRRKSTIGINWPGSLQAIVKELPQYYRPVVELPQHLGRLLREMGQSRPTKQQQQQPQARSDDKPK